MQHFCQDLALGLDLGWGGLLAKVRHYRNVNHEHSDFYDGLEDVILGIRDWIERHSQAAREMAAEEKHPQLRENLEAMERVEVIFQQQAQIKDVRTGILMDTADKVTVELEPWSPTILELRWVK